MRTEKGEGRARGVVGWGGGGRCTPYCTEDEFDSSVFFARQVQAYGYGCFGDCDGADVVHGGYVADFDAVD